VRDCQIIKLPVLEIFSCGFQNIVIALDNLIHCTNNVDVEIREAMFKHFDIMQSPHHMVRIILYELDKKRTEMTTIKERRKRTETTCISLFYITCKYLLKLVEESGPSNLLQDVNAKRIVHKRKMLRVYLSKKVTMQEQHHERINTNLEFISLLKSNCAEYSSRIVKKAFWVEDSQSS
jgi:hypothetical protein